MENKLFVVFGLLFVILMGGRVFLEKALASVDTDEREKLVDMFSKMRLWSIVPIFLMVLSYFFVNEYLNIGDRPLFIIYMIPIGIYTIIINIYTYKKLISNKISKKYIKNYVISRTITIVGIAVLLGLFYSIK